MFYISNVENKIKFYFVKRDISKVKESKSTRIRKLYSNNLLALYDEKDTLSSRKEKLLLGMNECSLQLILPEIHGI